MSDTQLKHNALKQKEFCDIGLVVTLGEPCQLCHRKLVHADCETWLRRSRYKPYPRILHWLVILLFIVMGLLTILWLERLLTAIPQLNYLNTIILGKAADGQGFNIEMLALSLPSYPFTIQNLTILIFFIGLGEAFFRWISTGKEKLLLDDNYLPSDERSVLDNLNLAKVRRNVGQIKSQEQGFVLVLIDLCVKRFLNSQSIEQTLSALKGKIDFLSHKLDIRYTLLRYLIWVIPTIGFIGTVLGISFAIMGINPTDVNLEQVIASLGIAFNTTLVALVLSALLNLFYNLVLSAEEDALNKAGNYVLNNMVNRLDPLLDKDGLETIASKSNNPGSSNSGSSGSETHKSAATRLVPPRLGSTRLGPSGNPI